MLPAFRADEQPEGPGRGGDSDGADLRLTDASPIRGEQFSFSPAEAKQIACFLAEKCSLLCQTQFFVSLLHEPDDII